jgi:colanic acid/amylovoran biosynthesis glycosyltransferase
MSVGRLVRMKGFDVLLRASRILLNREFQHRVVILGDGPERNKLERLRGRLSLDEVVELKGHASPNEVRKMLRTAALFVLPAIWDPIDGTQDGVPVALMEAMALGVPVVSTTISGIPELIQDGVNGLLVAPNDADALAQQIKYGCEMSGDARVEMLRRARQKIETDHDIETLTAHLLKMFEGIKCAG